MTGHELKPGDAVRFTSTGQIGVVAEVKPSVANVWMLDAARSSLVRLCRELNLPIYEDPRNGVRGLQTDMAVLRDWLADSQGHVTYLKTLLRSAIETMRKAKNRGFAEIAAFCVEGRLSAARDVAVSWIAEMEAQASAMEDDHE